MQHFESQYPTTARAKEIEEILRFISYHQSCQIISVPGAGRSTVLRLLAYHEKLREHHLHQFNNSTMKQSSNYLFAYANFAEIANFEQKELLKFLFLSLIAAIENIHPRGVHPNFAKASLGESATSGVAPGDSPEVNLYQEVSNLFKEALTLNDELILLQNLKKAIVTIQQYNNATIVFLFDRFSEYVDKMTDAFFSHLKALQRAAGGRCVFVFSAHQPLDTLLAAQTLKNFYEFFMGNTIYLTLRDNVTTDYRIGIIEKETGKKLAEDIKKQLLDLTGGHGKLMKLSVAHLFEPTHSEFKTLTDHLLSTILVKGSLLEIWQSLTNEQRKTLKDGINNLTMQQLNNNFYLPFPLLSEFIKRNIAHELIPKTIRLEQKTNEIYFGDDPLEGLTAQEFRLLSFLIKNPSRVCDRNEVIEATWQDSKTQQGVSDEALDQMIHRLRKKIEDEADNPKHLLTVKGRGFRFIP